MFINYEESEALALYLVTLYPNISLFMCKMLGQTDTKEILCLFAKGKVTKYILFFDKSDLIID